MPSPIPRRRATRSTSTPSSSRPGSRPTIPRRSPAGCAARSARGTRAAIAARAIRAAPSCGAASATPRRRESNERAALDAYQRAVVTAPESDGALAARRGLIELAASFGKSAQTSRFALVEAEQNPGDIVATARALAKSGDVEDARAMYELARALLDEPAADSTATHALERPSLAALSRSDDLGTRDTDLTLSRDSRSTDPDITKPRVELLAEDETFLDRNAPRVMASDEAYAASLDETERRALVDDPDDGVLGELLSMLGEVANLVCPDAKTAIDARRALRCAPARARRAMPPPSPRSIRRSPRPSAARRRCSTRARSRARPTCASCSPSPPVLVLGPRLASIRARSRSDVELDVDAELRFRLGRIVELSRPHRLFAAGTDPDDFARFVAGLVHAFGPKQAAVERNVATEAERLRQALPVALRRRLTERLATELALDSDALPRRVRARRRSRRPPRVRSHRHRDP